MEPLYEEGSVEAWYRCLGDDRQPQINRAVPCVFYERKKYTTTDGDHKYTVELRWNEFTIPSGSCPPFPNQCDNFQVVNTSSSTICLEFGDSSNLCLARDSAADFTGQIMCNVFWTTYLPHSCDFVLTNSLFTVISLAANNSLTVFSVCVSLSFLLFPHNDDEEEEEAKNGSGEQSSGGSRVRRVDGSRYRISPEPQEGGKATTVQPFDGTNRSAANDTGRAGPENV